ncbi:MAG: helix-turn-helix domain-containing protein [Treponema sp.]|nr:helix-turn-helix domain-containing protein [Treponema sp.]
MVLTKREASEKLRISVKTLERKINDGSLPTFKIGSRVLIQESDLDLFIQKCRKPVIEGGAA